jgi:hypothetical protein
LVLQDVETDATVAIDVGVIDLGCEVYFGRLEGLCDVMRITEERRGKR